MKYNIVIDKWDEYAERRLSEEFGSLSILNYDDSFGDFSCLLPYRKKIYDLSISMLIPDGHKIGLLENIRRLSITEVVPSLNFSCFPYLEDLDFEWNRKYSLDFLKSPNINRLCVRKWPYPDLEKIIDANFLVELSIDGGGLQSLNGAKELPKLTELRLSSCRKLVDFSDLSKLESLHEVDFYGLPIFDAYENMGGLVGLEKIKLSCLGKKSPVKNNEWMKNLVRLKFFEADSLFEDFCWDFFTNKVYLESLGVCYVGGSVNPFEYFSEFSLLNKRRILSSSGRHLENKRSTFFLSLSPV